MSSGWKVPAIISGGATFTPTSRGTSLYLWLKRDTGLYQERSSPSTASVGGALVGTWQDASGGGRDWVAPSDAARPTKIGGMYHGWGGVRSDGSNDVLQNAAMSLTQPFTVYAVARFRALVSNYNLLFDQSGTEGLILAIAPTNTFDMYGGTDLTNGATYSASTVNVISAVFNGASSKFRVNGTETTGNAGASNPTGTFYAFRNKAGLAFYQTDLIEVVITTGADNASQIAQMEAYLAQTNPIPTNTYILPTFKTTETDHLYLLYSGDGLTFHQYDSTYVYAESAGRTTRDPSIYFDGTTYFVAYTNKDLGSASTSFGIASSTDLVTWTFVNDVDLSAISGIDRAWTPRWFVDPATSKVYIIIAVGAGGGDAGPFVPYYIEATNAAMTTWGTPTAFGNVRTNMIDIFVFKDGSTYYMWFKNEDTKYIEVASSSAVFTGYSLIHTADWASWGSGIEGPSLVKIGPTWYLYSDSYLAGTGIAYATSSDLNTWSARTNITAPFTTRNGAARIRTSTGMGMT